MPLVTLGLSGTVLDHSQAVARSRIARSLDQQLDFGEHIAGQFPTRSALVYDLGYTSLRARLLVTQATIVGGGGRFSIDGLRADARWSRSRIMDRDLRCDRRAARNLSGDAGVRFGRRAVTRRHVALGCRLHAECDGGRDACPRHLHQLRPERAHRPDGAGPGALRRPGVLHDAAGSAVPRARRQVDGASVGASGGVRVHQRDRRSHDRGDVRAERADDHCARGRPRPYRPGTHRLRAVRRPGVPHDAAGSAVPRARRTSGRVSVGGVAEYDSPM
jgi:hypothetical protein